MAAKRLSITLNLLPQNADEADCIRRLALASALLAKGAARRQKPAAQSKVEMFEEFIHNTPLTPGGLHHP